jgi:hypothetical protein
VLRGSFAEVVVRAASWMQEGPALLLGDVCAQGSVTRGEPVAEPLILPVTA